MITISGGTPVIIIEDGHERELMYNLPDEGGITPTGSQTFTENGTYDVTAIAEAIVNVAGGGGGGLEYETGTYTPESDVTKPEIPFANAHINRPMYVLMSDVSEEVQNPNDALEWAIINWYDTFGCGFKPNNNQTNYARTQAIGMSESNFSASSGNITSLDGDSANTDMGYYLKNTAFYPYTGTSTRYWRAGRTYKWIAVWAPETGE